jgi:hypothetical protein
MPSLLIKNRTKTITKSLSGAHKKSYPHLDKVGLVKTSHMRHRHHFSPRKQHLQSTNLEQTNLTLPNTIVEPTNTTEAMRSQLSHLREDTAAPTLKKNYEEKQGKTGVMEDR